MVSIPNNNRFICLAAALCLLATIATITATSTSTGGLRTVSSSRRRHNDRDDDDTVDRELQRQQQQFANPIRPVPKPTKRPSKKPTKRPTKKRPTRGPTKKPVTNPQLQQAELCTISNTGCQQSINNNLNLLLPGQACPTACIEVWDPVCDCFGRQHSNVCVAHSVGVSVVKRVNPNTGEC